MSDAVNRAVLNFLFIIFSRTFKEPLARALACAYASSSDLKQMSSSPS
jgi:hypothetical protein